VAVSVAPKFRLSTLVFPAVAVVEVKICKGVWRGKVVRGPEAIAGFVGADNRPASASEETATARRPARHGRMLTQGDIGPLLRPFAIRSKTLWSPAPRPGTQSRSGYSRQQSEAAWASHCELSATPPQASKIRYLLRP
jgi:hypothetical protein